MSIQISPTLSATLVSKIFCDPSKLTLLGVPNCIDSSFQCKESYVVGSACYLLHQCIGQEANLHIKILIHLKLYYIFITITVK